MTAQERAQKLSDENIFILKTRGSDHLTADVCLRENIVKVIAAELETYAADTSRWNCESCTEAGRVEGLSRGIEEAKIKCVNKHADAERLIEWMQDTKRKPATLAFTEGPERQVAYEFEKWVRNVEGSK